jgi:hypothetical protein
MKNARLINFRRGPILIFMRKHLVLRPPNETKWEGGRGGGTGKPYEPFYA